MIRYLHTFLLLLTLSQFAQASIIVADSVAEFSSVQGQANWYYGYIEPVSGSAFIAMGYYNTVLDWWQADPNRYWTTLYAIGGHPNGVFTSGDRTPIEHWAVRRWVSEVEGEIDIVGNLAKNSTSGGGLGGNGIVGSIVVDGIEIWSQHVSPFDTNGYDYHIKTIVSLGSVIDFLIKPYETNDISDDTRFTATITVVPEPSAVSTTLAGVLALVAYRRSCTVNRYQRNGYGLATSA